MKHDRVADITACCFNIIRNADKIADEYGMNQSLQITIDIQPNQCPVVRICKTVVPKEIFKDMTVRSDEQC